MHDELEINRDIKGEIEITDLNGKVLYHKENALQPYSKIALVNMLAGNIGYNPKSIKVWLAGTNIATSLISSHLLNVSGSIWVKAIAFFDATDFLGPLDELTLECVGGRFSDVTGLSFSKAGDQAIYVSWKITII